MEDFKSKYYKYKLKYLKLKEATLDYPNDLVDYNLEKCNLDNFDVKIIDDFLSKEECLEIINLAKPLLIRSEIVDNNNKISDYRTSSGVFIKSDKYDTLKKISEKVAEIVGIPRENQEDIQVINYQPGQYYKQHYDACVDNSKECEKDRESGIRKNTFFIYLSDVEEGGYTAFPNLKKKFIPKQGRAIYWNNILNENNKYIYDPCSLHLGVKPDKGEKWALTVWSRI